MLAKDVMSRKVVTLTPGLPLAKAAALFEKHAISGAPVVGPDGGLIGILSQTDILGARRPGLRVEQAMTPWAVSFEEDTPVRELARQMRAKRIHRVVITRGGAICGIATSMDLLRALVDLLDP